MGSVFGGGSYAQQATPYVQAVANPAEDKAAQQARDLAAEEERRKRGSGGMYGNIFTSGLGDTTNANVGSKTLLGQ